MVPLVEDLGLCPRRSGRRSIDVMATHRPDASRSASSTEVLLADGSVGVVRRLAPQDAVAVAALHARATDDSLRLRFFTASHRSAQHYVEHVMASPETLALVMDVRGSVVALATAEPIDETSSEIAFLVDDTLHGHGLGTLLLEHLAAHARDQGVATFVAEVLVDNHRMLHLFLDAGYAQKRHVEGGVVTLSLDTLVTAEVQAAADDRECRAEARSLGALRHPESVVVIGVRRDGSGVGAGIVRSIVSGGFTGRLALAHPEAGTGVDPVPGVDVHATARDVPGGVDLAVVALPARQCLAAVEDAAAAGAGVVVVVSSGFAEDGAAGRRLQHDVATRARLLGVRLVGPNCLGVVANGADVCLDATFGTGIPLRGGLALASQSGGVGIALVERARAEGLGLSCFVSLGNKADVSGNDLLGAWYDDPGVTLAALYLESFGNARKFARLARRFSQRKPLLAVVGGRSSGGRRAGASHTAAAASSTVGVEALFTQAGVIGCDDVDDLVDTARLLAEQRLPRGARVAVISNAGGMGVLAADRADDLGLDVPELSPDLQQRLRAASPAVSGTANPVDTGAGVSGAELGALVAEVLASGEVDVVVVVLVPTALGDGADLVAAVATAHGRHRDIPLVLVPLGGIAEAAASPTTYTGIRAALAAIRRVTTYATWRSVEHDPVVGDDVSAGARARQVAAGLSSSLGPASSGWVSAGEAAELLVLYGIDLVGTLATSAETAVQAARALGYPVVVKSDERSVVHKTERGLVHLGVDDDDQVRSAVADLVAELGRAGPVLVQPTAGGVEVALGIARDASLGPLVMVAAGGVATEVWDDRVFLLAPVTAAEAARALRSLRLWPLLDGFRGSAPCDVAALEHLVVAVGRLALDVPAITELDLNPVLVGPRGCSVVDVALRLADTAALTLRDVRGLRPVD